MFRRTRARTMVGSLAAAVVLTATAMTAAPATAAPTRDRVESLQVQQQCNAFGGAFALGTSMQVKGQTIRACGPRPAFSLLRGVLQAVLPFLGSIATYPGYQCVELSTRYLAAADGVTPPPGIMNGAQVVDSYASRFPRVFVKIANGTRNKAPVRGDVLSLANNKRFAGVGHTGVVLWSHVNKSGNGQIKTMEQNWGGPGGGKGWHIYQVRRWKVSFPLLAQIKWLHRR